MRLQLIVSPSVGRAIGYTFAAIGMALAICGTTMPLAQAQSDDAAKILKSMSDYVNGQKSLSITFDSDIEVITDSLQKLQFTSSGQVQLSRPDKLRATRTGGYKDVEIVFDGKTLTMNDKDANGFAQIDSAGSVDQLIDVLREKHGVVAPGADLLLSNAFDVMMADVVESAHVGKGVIDGVECDHLAFRNIDTDWQIWIEAGARPIPRKYVITSKGVTGAPQYTLRIKEWRSDVPADALRSSRLKARRKSPWAISRTSTKSRRGRRGQERRNEPQVHDSHSPLYRCRCRRRGPVVERTIAARTRNRRSYHQPKPGSAAR